MDMTPIVQIIKEKIDKLNYVNIRNFYASKNTIKKMKGKPIKWKNKL